MPFSYLLREANKILLTTVLLVALQKTPSLLGAECQGVGTTPLHANERGQTRTPSLLGDIYFKYSDYIADFDATYFDIQKIYYFELTKTNKGDYHA